MTTNIFGIWQNWEYAMSQKADCIKVLNDQALHEEALIMTSSSK